MNEDVSDAMLIDQCRGGDLTAYDTLVLRYQDRLVHSLELSLGSYEDALEIAQQAFVSAWRNLGAFRQDAAFYSWLYRIAMNAAISRRRRNRVKTSSLDSAAEATGRTPADQSAAADPQHRLIENENVQLVRSALSRLPEEFRQPLVLKEIDGLTYEQIADIMDIPIGTVRSRIFRARRELTAHLERLTGETARDGDQ
ncbi:MAG: sigma-70 family RNA polymerase sigma factor [Planctomycetaceae bacterium]|nr:sigma-70 family RNA polymerase sigma factor [Planctomycetaceae bacterium]